jgi:tetratricopeptide (TPR) repeat protein
MENLSDDDPTFDNFGDFEVENDEFEKNEEKTISTALELMKGQMYFDAATLWSELCEHRVKKYGELGYECADIYLYYAQSLLRHSQSKDEIFAKFNKAVNQKLGGDDDIDPEDEDNDIIAVSFQIAEKIYLQALASKKYPMDESGIRSKLFNLYEYWGDFYLENDNFDDAIKEFEKCLVYGKDDRLKAHIHMQLSTAYSHLADTPRSVAEFENALKALEKQEEKLKDDLMETQSLISDLRDRVVELKDDLVLAEKKKVEELELNKRIEESKTGEATVLIPRKKDEKRKLEDNDDTSNKKIKN